MEQSSPRVFSKLKQLSVPSGGTSTSNKVVVEETPNNVVETKVKQGVQAVKPSSSMSTSSILVVSKKVSSVKSSSTSSKKGSGEEEEGGEEQLAITAEEATEVLQASLDITGWDDSFQPLMCSTKWQDKVEALQVMEKHVVDFAGEGGGRLSAAVVRYLSEHTGGFKISNTNILKGVISTCCAAAQMCRGGGGGGQFSRGGGGELIRHFGDKLGDKKTKELVHKLLTSLSDCLSPQFVTRRMKGVLDKSKAPLVHQHYLEWLGAAIKEFGCTAFSLPPLVSFCQEEMDNKVSSVRTAAVEVLGEVFHQVGPNIIWGLLGGGDCKPQMRTLLEGEFLRVGHDPHMGGVGGKGGNTPLFVVPRQEVWSLLDRPSSTTSDLCVVDGKNSWQVRKAALEAVINACIKSGHHLEFGRTTADLVKAVKGRINDTQANLKPLAVSAIGHLVSSFDSDAAAKCLRQVGGGLLLGLADNKKPMRDATIAALHMAVSNSSGQPDGALVGILVQPVCESLSNPIGRLELLTWLLTNVDCLRGRGGGTCGRRWPVRW